jgi:hypothetical protein
MSGRSVIRCSAAVRGFLNTRAVIMVEPQGQVVKERTFENLLPLRKQIIS